MNELIKIKEENGKKLVSAKELYIGLKYEDRNDNFSKWIKKQLESVDAVENVDFTTIWSDVFKNVVEFNGNVNSMTAKGYSIDYILTVDIAKEICMCVGVSPRTNEETRKLSKEYRKYFIECEKKLEQLSPMQILELQFKVLKDQEKQLNEVKEDVKQLKEDTPLFNVECDTLQARVRNKGIEVLGGYHSKAYNDRSIRTKVYKDIQHQIKRNFNVTTYKAIKRKDFSAALEIIKKYQVPVYLEKEIEIINNQITINQ